MIGGKGEDVLISAVLRVFEGERLVGTARFLR